MFVSVLAFLMNYFREQITAIYSTDSHFCFVTENLLSAAALAFFFDGMATYFLKPTNALDMEPTKTRISYATFMCNFALGMPLACILGLYYDYDVIGFQLAIIIAAIAKLAVSGVLLKQSDW